MARRNSLQLQATKTKQGKVRCGGGGSKWTYIKLTKCKTFFFRSGTAAVKRQLSYKVLILKWVSMCNK